jgi:hypothetical protein
MQVAVLEFHAGRSSGFRRERNLDFGDELGIELPVGRELPREDDARRRIPLEHLPGVTLGSVDTHCVPSPADRWLDDALRHRRRADVVLSGPP